MFLINMLSAVCARLYLIAFQLTHLAFPLCKSPRGLSCEREIAQETGFETQQFM